RKRRRVRDRRRTAARCVADDDRSRRRQRARRAPRIASDGGRAGAVQRVQRGDRRGIAPDAVRARRHARPRRDLRRRSRRLCQAGRGGALAHVNRRRAGRGALSDEGPCGDEPRTGRQARSREPARVAVHQRHTGRRGRNKAVSALRKRFAAGLCCVLGARASIAAAQSARPGRPEPLPERPFKFPHIGTHPLPNGLRLLVVEDHSLPLVAVRAVLPVDSTADPSGREGLYAVTLGAMREGTATRTADQLADAFAELGRTVAPTGFTALASSFRPGLELMSDMLQHPAFDSTGIERRKALQASAAVRLAQAAVTAPRQIFYAELSGPSDGYVRSLRPTAASHPPTSRPFTRDTLAPPARRSSWRETCRTPTRWPR